MRITPAMYAALDLICRDRWTGSERTLAALKRQRLVRVIVGKLQLTGRGRALASETYSTQPATIATYLPEPTVSYTCPTCKHTSDNATDEKYKYCPFCHQFEETLVHDQSVGGPSWVWILTTMIVIALLGGMVWTLFPSGT